MKDEQELYDFIDRYLKDAGSEEVKSLPNGMDEASFKEEIAYQQTIKDALLINRLGQLRQTLHKVDRDAKSKANIIKGGLASIVALGLGAAAILYFAPTRQHRGTSLEPTRSSVAEIPKKEATSQKTAATSLKAESTMKTEKQPLHNSNTKHTATNTTVLSDTVELTPSLAIKELSVPESPIKQTEMLAPTDQSAEDPCKGIKLGAQYTYTNPCVGTSDGSIRIEQAHGGKAPYGYSLNNDAGFQKQGTFDHLSKGTYELRIRDAHGCNSDILAKVTLIEKGCTEGSSPNQVFNPAHEVWELPNVKGLGGMVELYNSRGALVYRANFGKFENIKWDGSILQSEPASPGIYVYKIQYEDSDVQQGSVTVVY